MSLRARQLRSEHAGHESPTRQFGKWFTRGVAGAALGLAVAGTSAFTLLAPGSAIAQPQAVLDRFKQMYENAKPYRNPGSIVKERPSLSKPGYFSAELEVPLPNINGEYLSCMVTKNNRRGGRWEVDVGTLGKVATFDVTDWVQTASAQMGIKITGFDFIFNAKLSGDGKKYDFVVGVVPLANGTKPLFSDDGSHQLQAGHHFLAFGGSVARDETDKQRTITREEIVLAGL